MLKNKYLLLVPVVFIASLLTSTCVSAFRATQYETKSHLYQGMVASIDNSGHISPSSLNQGDYLGVVTKSHDKTAEIADSGSGVTMLVLAKNSKDLKVGTKLSLSYVAGVAKVWQPGNTKIAVISDNSSKPVSVEINTDGSKKDVKVFKVRANLYTPGSKDTGYNGSYLSSIQKMAGRIVGHPVDLWKAIIALIISIGGIILSTGFLFVTGWKSFTSIGRNPLSESIISKSLWKVSALAISILIVCLLVSYYILNIGS